MNETEIFGGDARAIRGNHFASGCASDYVTTAACCARD
jgi:hypothetical protein